MAEEKNPIRIKCPSCAKTLAISGLRGATMINCPYCRTRIRVTAQEQPPPGSGVPAFDEDDVDIYERDVRFFESLPLIKNIVVKDILSLKKLFIILFVIGLILAVFMTPPARSMARSNLDEQDTQDDNQPTAEEIAYEEEMEKQEELNNIWNSYAIFILVMSIITILLVNHLYGLEVKRGTMRLLCLYPVNMNGITLAKITSISIILGLIQLLILGLPLYPYVATGAMPWISTVLFMTYFTNVFIIITGGYGSHIISFVTGKLTLGMNRLIGIMVIIYIFFTETIITGVGTIVIVLNNVSDQKANEMYQDFVKLGQELGNLSPYHSGGRMLTNSLGHNSGGPDVALVIFIGLVLIIGGYIVGKKIYLDIFIRE